MKPTIELVYHPRLGPIWVGGCSVSAGAARIC